MNEAMFYYLLSQNQPRKRGCSLGGVGFGCVAVLVILAAIWFPWELVLK